MKFNLIWEAEPPTLTSEQSAALASELAWLEARVDDASEVVSHVVNLTTDYSGPSITLHGKDQNKTDLFLSYNKKTEWIILDNVEEYKE